MMKLLKKTGPSTFPILMFAALSATSGFANNSDRVDSRDLHQTVLACKKTNAAGRALQVGIVGLHGSKKMRMLVVLDGLLITGRPVKFQRVSATQFGYATSEFPGPMAGAPSILNLLVNIDGQGNVTAEFGDISYDRTLPDDVGNLTSQMNCRKNGMLKFNN